MSKEIELAFFCEVTEPAGYAEAIAVEDHLQYEYRPPADENGNRRGRVRIRMTKKNGIVSYTQTIKTPIDKDSKLGDHEETIEISESFFETWRKAFCSSGQKKIRYVYLAEQVVLKVDQNSITMPKVKFQVDRFYNAEGKMSQWVKVDIEIQDIVDYLKDGEADIKNAKFDIDFSNLPLGIKRVVSMVTEDPDERAGIDNFFRVFSVPA